MGRHGACEGRPKEKLRSRLRSTGLNEFSAVHVGACKLVACSSILPLDMTKLLWVQARDTV